jgi:hypothetical protein
VGVIPAWSWILLIIAAAYLLIRLRNALDIERPPSDTERCPWTTSMMAYRCVERVGHRGKCRIKDDLQRDIYWYGINYRKNGDL